jgi:hypothetical protein
MTTPTTCPHCNRSLAADWQFCPGCGEKRPAPVSEMTEAARICVELARVNAPSAMDWLDWGREAKDHWLRILAKARELLSPTIAAEARRQAFSQMREHISEEVRTLPRKSDERMALEMLMDWAEKKRDACQPAAPEPTRKTIEEAVTWIQQSISHTHAQAFAKWAGVRWGQPAAPETAKDAPDPPTGLQCEECGGREVAPERVHWVRPVCDVCLPPGNRAKERPPEPAKDAQPSEPPPPDATETPALDKVGNPGNRWLRKTDVRNAYRSDLATATKSLRERAEKAELEQGALRAELAQVAGFWGEWSQRAFVYKAEAERFAASEQLERAHAERDRDQYREEVGQRDAEIARLKSEVAEWQCEKIDADSKLWSAMRTLLRDAQTVTAISDGTVYLDKAATLAVQKAREVLGIAARPADKPGLPTAGELAEVIECAIFNNQEASPRLQPKEAAAFAVLRFLQRRLPPTPQPTPEPPPADATETPALDAVKVWEGELTEPSGSKFDSRWYTTYYIRTAYAADLSRATKALRERAEKAERERDEWHRKHENLWQWRGSLLKVLDEEFGGLHPSGFTVENTAIRILRSQAAELAALKAAKPEPGKGFPAVLSHLRRWRPTGQDRAEVDSAVGLYYAVGEVEWAVAHDTIPESWRRTTKGEPQP